MLFGSFCRLHYPEQLQDYLKNLEKKPRKKLILPPILPWEYGSNKFASQKGTGGFGSMRNATTSVKSSKELSESNDGVVPRFGCPPLWDKELGTQSGLIPFGGIREHALKVQDKDGEERKDINKLAKRESESILKIWAKPNPEAKLSKPFGHKRNEVTETVGGRKFSSQELQASRAAIPRFQDPRNTIAAKAEKASDIKTLQERKRKDSSGGLIIPPPFAHLAMQQSRFYSQKISDTGASNSGFSSNGNEENELTAEQYMAWLGGQVTMQTRNSAVQQRKPRSYASYYDRLMSERTPTKREIRERLKKLELQQQENIQESLDGVDGTRQSDDQSTRRDDDDDFSQKSNDENQNLQKTKEFQFSQKLQNVEQLLNAESAVKTEA